MMDFMFKAASKADWDAFAALLPAGATVDEIGVIGEAPDYHVNVRFTEPVDGTALLASVPDGVQWVDPDTVDSPARVWSGGMFYWRLSNP